MNGKFNVFILLSFSLLFIFLLSCGKANEKTDKNTSAESEETVLSEENSFAEIPSENTSETNKITETTEVVQTTTEVPTTTELPTTEKLTEKPTEPPTTKAPETKEKIEVRKIDMNAEYNQPKCKFEDIIPGAHPIENTYIGYDGFMFFGDTMRDYKGTNVYATDEKMQNVADMYKSYSDWCKENGITFYLLIPPNKNTIYFDFMHENIKKGETSKRDELIKYLRTNTDIKVIEVKEELLAAKEETPARLLYFKLDTHWNQNAGFIVYNKIISELKKDFPSLSGHERNDYEIKLSNSYFKDMPWYLGFYDTFEEKMPQYTLKENNSAKLVKCDKPKEWYGIFAHAKVDSEGYHDMNSFTQYKNDDKKDQPSLFMVRDSFAIALIPFLKDSFSFSSYQWTTDFNKSDILKQKPDIVIYEIVERILP